MKSEIGFFDRRAANWEKNCYPPPVRMRLAELISEFGICSGMRVLDIGTGPGILIPYVKERVGETGEICAFDISFQMVIEASKKINTSDGWVLQADAHKIPLNGGIFDLVICFAAFPHFKRPDAALAEMSRVLKSRGRIVIAHLLSRQELAKHHACNSAVADDILPDAPRMQALLQHAGFDDITITDSPGRYLAKGAKH